jgi:hypothetical protein
MPEDGPRRRGMEDAERKQSIASLDADVTAAAAAFDKIVSYLAGGALALSITFLHDIAPAPVHEGRLAIAWTALWGALIASMFSFIASDSANRKLIDRLSAGEGLKRDWRYYATLVLNWVSAAGVVVGTGSLAWFAYANVPIGGKA